MKDTPSQDYLGLEKEYLQLKQTLFKKLFSYLLIANVMIVIIEVLRAIYRGQPDNLVGASISLCFTAFLSKFINRLKEKQELVITIYMIIFYTAALIVKYYQKVGLFGSPLDSFYFAYHFCVFDRIVLARIPTLKYRIIYALATTIIRVMIVPFNDKGLFFIQFAYVFFGIYLEVDKEKNDKNLFESYFKSKNQLDKFKNLVVNDIPAGIIIIKQDLTQSLFANKSFSMLSDFNSNSDICAHLNQFKTYEEETKPQSQEIITTVAPKKTLLNFVESTILRSDFQNNQKFSCNVIYTQNRNEYNKVSILEAKVFHIVWDEIPAVAVILHDITQQHTIISLKTANDQKDALLATVSHELRTPLNGMIGMIQVLQKRTQDSESMRYLNICKNSGNLLMGLVNSILDFNQIRAKKFKLNPERINLLELLRDIVQLFELQCTQKKISLKLNISLPTQKYIVTDPNRLTQIFINLIGNALKFTMKGGIIISAKESSDGKHVQLAVEDTGIGIKDQDKGKLFKMFGKLEHSDSQTNKQGVGLGLTISDNLARLLCGEDDRGGIKLTSSYGIGSVFSFWIQSHLIEDNQRSDECLSTIIAEEDTDLNETMKKYATMKSDGPSFQRKTSESRNEVLGTSIVLNTSKYRTEGHIKLDSQILKPHNYVLIVDDNPFNITVAEYLITSYGYKVKTALYGQTAIDIILNNHHSAEPIKVILMDCMMPIMSGYEVTRILKKLMRENKIPEIPIIALTANNSEADKEASRKAGMCEHLTKPLKESDLYKMLDRYAR